MINYINKNPKYFFYIPLVFYWILIIVLTSLPSNSLPKVALSDKVNHFLAYFGLAVLLGGTLFHQRKFNFLSSNYILATIIIASFYGLVDEIHQLFIPGRYCELYDWLANFVGVIAGTFFIYLFLKGKEKRNSIEV